MIGEDCQVFVSDGRAFGQVLLGCEDSTAAGKQEIVLKIQSLLLNGPSGRGGGVERGQNKCFKKRSSSSLIVLALCSVYANKQLPSFFSSRKSLGVFCLPRGA